MIVCSCNILSDKEITDCLQRQGGGCRVRDVFHDLGCVPQCGRCARTINGMIAGHCEEHGQAVLESDSVPELLQADCG